MSKPDALAPQVAPRAIEEATREPGQEHQAAAPDPQARGPESESPPSLFGQVLKARTTTRPAWPTGEPFVAECVDPKHPTLQGRVQIRWDAASSERVEWWVPTLHGLSIRAGDRLLVQMPYGGPEPIVLGVIDGFADRPAPERTAAARLELKRDEVLEICTEEGQPLIEVIQDDGGPVVRLLQSDTRVDVQGKLSISAAELELSARNGKVRIAAADDVDVVGEVIHLN